MALIEKGFYSGPALIVGDGNFSFSACLAQSVGEIATQVFATSLDTKEQLQSNLLARKNIAKMSEFSSFNVIHGVDATNLEATFKDQRFHRIIFNFPHTGGKLKIGKCRDLLEKFFISASRHIDPSKGIVCVSLCQGQGGTPRDCVQRDYGNTWQVIQQATKAGLILNAVHPFKEADYPGYSSAGFKGRLNQRFTADKGLTYMFITGSSTQSTHDIQSFLKTRKTSNSYKSLYLIDGNPVCIVKRKIEKVFTTDDMETKFDIKNDSKEECVNNLGEKLTRSMKLSESSACTLSISLYQDVCQLIRGQNAFVVSGIESDFSVPPSSGSYPITHYTAISKSYDTITTVETMKSELDITIKAVINAVCPEITLTNESSNTTPCNYKDDLNFPKCQLNLFKPVDYQRLRERKRTHSDWRPTEMLKCSRSDCCNSKSCTICQLEDKYFSKEDNMKVSDLLEDSTVKTFYCDGRVIFTYGLVKQEESEHKAWVILVHIDNLTMTLCGISDIRMLWSSDRLFLQQFDRQDQESLPNFVPFSLFPPIYIHDISLWLTANSTEWKFFQAIHEVTRDLVSDVWLRERYVDESKFQVSYSYRMVYCRCDGPLSHLQTVEIQNALRLLLLDMKFKLS